MKNSKKRIFDIIQIGNNEDLPSRLFDFFIVIVIFFNISILFLDTFEQLDDYKNIFKIIEVITIIIFCIEYLLRIWTADYLYPGYTKWKARLKFLVSFDGIVDLFTILPFFFLSGFVAFRMLRVVRIFHLFRINAYYDSFNVITSVLYEKRNQIVSSIVIIIILMVSSSLCMYSAEHNVQPDVFDNAFSGLWWSISTILTVGYGDIYPITVLGRCMAIVIAMLGVGAVAIPTGIISAGFVERYTNIQTNQTDKKNEATISVKIEDNSVFLNKNVLEIEKKYNINAVVIVKNGNVVIPTSDVKIELGDTLVYLSENILM